MQSNKVIKCINRVKNLSKEYQTPLPKVLEYMIEKELNIILPIDFKQLCQVCRYDYFDYFAFYNFRIEDKFSVIAQTKSLREVWGLPNEYVVLFEDDVSMIMLKTISVEKSEVIWLNQSDFDNICAGKHMQYNPTIFPCFVDFYEFLLDEEEKIRAEDQLLDN